MYFTERRGIEIPEAPITIRDDAPVDFRRYLLQLMRKYETLLTIRSYICFVAKEAEDPNNWGENNYLLSEVQSLFESCPWYRIYDMIEYFYQNMRNSKEKFENQINEYLIEKGIGWKLVYGIIEIRGEEEFEKTISEVTDLLGASNLNTSQNEIREALKDLSKRPQPDITGSIQHSEAALECLCREVVGNTKLTLGQLIDKHPDIVPKPLNEVVSKIFGFASEQGRHLREGGIPAFEEAKLTVHLCASICIYLATKNFCKDDTNEVAEMWNNP